MQSNMPDKNEGDRLSSEIWATVDSAPAYEVSDAGRLRRDGRIIAGSRLRSGYIGCSVSQGGKRRSTTIHVLVAEAFIPRDCPSHEVNHKNGVKDDNRAENLEWVTHAQNVRHSFDVLGNKGRPKRSRPARTIPDLRRRITIEDFDSGESVRTVYELFATPRIDCYRVSIDGKPQAGRFGWSRILGLLRVAMPRKCSLRWVSE